MKFKSLNDLKPLIITNKKHRKEHKMSKDEESCLGDYQKDIIEDIYGKKGYNKTSLIPKKEEIEIIHKLNKNCTIVISHKDLKIGQELSIGAKMTTINIIESQVRSQCSVRLKKQKNLSIPHNKIIPKQYIEPSSISIKCDEHVESMEQPIVKTEDPCNSITAPESTDNQAETNQVPVLQIEKRLPESKQKPLPKKRKYVKKPKKIESKTFPSDVLNAGTGKRITRSSKNLDDFMLSSIDAVSLINCKRARPLKKRDE